MGRALGPRQGAEGASSSRSSNETFAGTTAGTPAYMSPEQFTGAPTDARADQFSFCASLWEALTGELPFGEGDPRELRRKVLAGVLVVPRRPAPRWIARLLVRGLSLRPEGRWPSMEVLLSLLRRDRLRRVRHVAEAALLLVVVAGAASFVGYRHHLEATRCQRESRAAAQSLWSSERRAALAAQGPDGAGIAGELDARVAEWEAARQAACESAARGLPASLEVLQCLGQYQQRARALIAHLPGLELQKVDALLDELSRPARCQATRPRDTGADADPQLLAESAEVAALFGVGRHEEAVTRGRALLARAHAAGAPHVAAFTGNYLGLALWEAEGPSDELYAIARQAVRDADLSGDGELSLRTRVRLFDALSEGQGRTAEAEEIALDAEAWLKRLGYPAHLDLVFTQARGTLLSRQGRHDEALTLFRHEVQLAVEVYGERSPNVADVYNTLGTELQVQGRLAEAAQSYLTALELHQRARWRSRPDEALAWGNLASTRLSQGRPEEALTALDSAEAIVAPISDQLRSYSGWLQVQRALVLEDLGRLDEAEELEREPLVNPAGLESDDLCELHASAARILVARGKPELARPLAVRAVELSRERAASPAARAQSAFALAQALWDLGERSRAVELAREALPAFAGAEDGYRRGKIERWLAAHPAPSR